MLHIITVLKRDYDIYYDMQHPLSRINTQ